MAIIKDGHTSVLVGLIINAVFLILKFAVFLYSHVNLFFADAIDSVADAFILFLLVLLLRFSFRTKVTFLSMDIMFGCQWSAVLLFRVIIFLEQISDLISPEPREQPVLVIAVSCIVLVLSIVLALVFVDEDDVIKEFIDADEKAKRKLQRARAPRKPSSGGSGGCCGGCGCPTVMPIFAEALDNLATTFIALIVGCLLYAGVAVDYLYIIDDVGNMLISCMVYFAVKGLLDLVHKYAGKSQYHVISDLSEHAAIDSDSKGGSEGGSVEDDRGAVSVTVRLLSGDEGQ